MKVFYCTDHEGHYPVGVCSIIVAESKEKASELLKAKLAEHGLTKNEPFTLNEVDETKEYALILNDGNY